VAGIQKIFLKDGRIGCHGMALPVGLGSDREKWASFLLIWRGYDLRLADPL